MKKPIFTALLATLAALMLTGCTSRHEAVNDSEVTASTDVAQMQTANYTAEPTAEPTALPTEAPSEAPNPYCMEEYEQLLKFFEIADENGVKNGEKCFKNYDPTRIEFWGAECENDISSVLTWDENGNLYYFYLCGIDNAPIQLSGELSMIGFGALKGIGCDEHVTLESAYISGGSNFSKASVVASADVYVVGEYFEAFNVSSGNHCHFESRDYQDADDAAISEYAFHVELTPEGTGSVKTSGWADENYYYAYVTAKPDDGHKFLGWYDAEGKLISEKAVIAIAFDEADHESNDEIAYIFDRNFTGIAKFE